MTIPAEPTPSFPRLQARSLRFTLGVPRALTIAPDGGRVYFLRTPDGQTRTGGLWALDIATGREDCLVDPGSLLGGDGEALSEQERARRERSRETGAGIVAYSMDDACEVAAFALSGQVWVCRTTSGSATALSTPGSAIDPRVDPTGRYVAYVADGALRIVGTDGTLDYPLAEPDGPEVTWGLAEFVAAEEMDRHRGFWWAPDGQSLLVTRTDDEPVETWWLADPAEPSREPTAHRYPAAGTDNAEVTLWRVGLDGSRTQVRWDSDAYEYLARVSWNEHGDPLLQVVSRDQREAAVLAVEYESGETTLVRSQHDDVWLDLVGGAPAYAPGGRLLTVEDVDDTKRVLLDGTPVSPPDLQVRSVVSVGDDAVLVTGSQEPTEVHLWAVGYDTGTVPLSDGPGVHGGLQRGGVSVRVRSDMDSFAPTITVARGDETVATLGTRPLDPGLRPEVRFLEAGDDGIRVAVLFPRGHEHGHQARLPILMNPYGGPHAQRVLRSARMFLEAQWIADQGFCVVVADGRGSPGRGRAWDRAIRDDFAGVTLDDQVVALDAVIDRYATDVDPDRVGIMGWSYGGYLAALAVLRRPDVFHAAVAGAPVTDWRMYDTYYTERYLGHPDDAARVYDENSLLAGLDVLDEVPPLLLVHGTVDDNVVVAHTLRLSSALLAAGKPHAVLPLTGVTHMTPQEVVAENLAMLEVDFLRTALA